MVATVQREDMSDLRSHCTVAELILDSASIYRLLGLCCMGDVQKFYCFHQGMPESDLDTIWRREAALWSCCSLPGDSWLPPQGSPESLLLRVLLWL